MTPKSVAMCLVKRAGMRSAEVGTEDGASSVDATPAKTGPLLQVIFDADAATARAIATTSVAAAKRYGVEIHASGLTVWHYETTASSDQNAAARRCLP